MRKCPAQSIPCSSCEARYIRIPFPCSALRLVFPYKSSRSVTWIKLVYVGNLKRGVNAPTSLLDDTGFVGLQSFFQITKLLCHNFIWNGKCHLTNSESDMGILASRSHPVIREACDKNRNKGFLVKAGTRAQNRSVIKDLFITKRCH